MGGCVSSVMESRNSNSMEEHPILKEFRSYGIEAVAIPGTESDTHSATYRIARSSDEEHERCMKDYYTGPNWVQTVQQRASEIPDRPAFAYRELLKTEIRVVKDPATGRDRKFEYYHCSSYKTISYHDTWERMVNFGKGLSAIGLEAKAMVSIYEESRWEWMVSMYGIWTQDMVASTVYSNLGEDALLYALKETESKAIICNGKALPTLTKLLRENQLRPILIHLDDAPAGFDCGGDFTVYPWLDVLAKGEAAVDAKLHIPTNNDEEALIMYTSGTTGNPKGVIHSHGTIGAGIRSLNQRLLDLYRPNEEGECYCAYLPLAHILEFALCNIFLARGSMVGFGNPRTLTDNFAIPHGDLREFKPRVIIAVPRIFDTIRKAVEAKLPPPGSFKRQIFDRAYESRRAALIAGQDTPYWNEKVFAVARNMLGGNIYGMLSGGGPLSASTQEFINVMCGGPLIIQGWGLTETVCCGATQRLGDLAPSCAGQVLKAAEFKLVDTEEYKHTDKPEPRGEICLRGPFLFKGYYKHPELTKEALDEDGWFHTGDVASINQKGSVCLVGRVKALAKNSLGEYIALENLEAIYNQNTLAAVNGVCVLVHPDKNYIAALVLTEHGRALQFAKEHGITGTYPEILSDAKFLEAAAASMASTAKEAGRRPFECVKVVRVLDDQWTPENGLMTPTAKLRRTQVDKHYATLIADIFKN